MRAWRFIVHACVSKYDSAAVREVLSTEIGIAP